MTKMPRDKQAGCMETSREEGGKSNGNGSDLVKMPRDKQAGCMEISRGKGGAGPTSAGHNVCRDSSSNQLRRPILYREVRD